MGTVRHLPRVVPTRGDAPDDVGTGHPMRQVTEDVATDIDTWTPELAQLVAAFFDDMAPTWAEGRTDRNTVLADALDRGGPLRGPVVEIGAGTGIGTAVLADRFDHVVAGDLSGEMLGLLPSELASRVRLDASRLPFARGSVGTLVCVNMFLFAPEVRHVLAPGGALVWVNSIGTRTPIHLSAEAVASALGDDFDVVASEADWGTWAVAHRSG